jgi:hypothetical protein
MFHLLGCPHTYLVGSRKTFLLLRFTIRAKESMTKQCFNFVKTVFCGQLNLFLGFSLIAN